MVSSFWWMADVTGCGMYRMAMPGSNISNAEMGVQMPPHVVVQGLKEPAELKDRYTKREVHHTDVVIGQRVCMPSPSGLYQALSMRQGLKTIYELDDLLMHCDPANAAAYQFFSQAETVAAITQNLRLSDAVIVSTEPLAYEMQAYNENVYVLPNYIEESIFDFEPAYLRRKAEDEIVIGWSGGNSHNGDFTDCRQALSRVLHRNPQTRLKTVGHDINAGIFNGNLPRHEHHEWINGFYSYYQLLDFDIGIAPLKDTRFNSCKSWLRCLEYAARGIPVVASDCDAYSPFVIHEVTGLLVSRDKEWREAIMYLIEDEEARLRMAENALSFAKNFTIQDNAWRYEQVLAEVCGVKEAT